jgi:tetratricopeptide (TPR) repeat protein
MSGRAALWSELGGWKMPSDMLRTDSLLAWAGLWAVLFVLLAGCGSAGDKKQSQAQEENLSEPAINQLIAERRLDLEKLPEGGPERDSMARSLLKAYQRYLEQYPQSDSVTSYLYSAADLSMRQLGAIETAARYYTSLYQDHPDHPSAPMALFMTGFIYDYHLGRYEEARERYRQFLDTYPEHHLADEAAFSLKHLGKSPEELLKSLRKDSLPS